jgi:hypothetical protein
MTKHLCEEYPEDFTKITLCIHNEVLKEMRSTMSIRGMVQGMFGITDSFIVKLLDGIRDEEDGIEFIKKTDKEKYES